MNIEIYHLIDGARLADGLVVIIDDAIVKRFLWYF